MMFLKIPHDTPDASGVRQRGTATGNAMEAVTNKTARAVTEAVHNNAQGFIIDDSLKH